MRKKLLSAVVVCLCFSLTSAKSSETEQVFDRQCCSKTVPLEDGNSITITACAGWFLSNDAAAYARACEKTREAIEAYSN
ncbi:hypothetical protein [Rufibacter sp. LB8]|uniref:hypothetical protein n=1 Tax=Rufibacter sp. LB8 TaxID=2777781 RepID=UPI00178C27FA|nr:hypothetical protein [Rufibacter sp. LB8]